jgi:hypothetical protein
MLNGTSYFDASLLVESVRSFLRLTFEANRIVEAQACLSHRRTSGVRWKRLKEHVVLPTGHFSSTNIVFVWDYVCIVDIYRFREYPEIATSDTHKDK